MRIVLLVIVAVVTFQYSASQSLFEHKHSIGIGTGYVSQYFIDRQASPLRYQDATVVYSLYYVRNTPHGQHRITVGYNNGTFTTPAGEPDRMIEQYDRLQLRGGYIHTIATFFDDRLRLMGGFYFDNFFTYRNHYYFATRNEIFVEYVSALHPVIEAFYRLGERSIVRSGAAVSAIAYVVGSPYSVRGPVQYTFQFFDSYRQADLLISYQRLLTDRMHIEVQYNFNYYRHTVPLELKFAKDQVLIYFGYRM